MVARIPLLCGLFLALCSGNPVLEAGSAQPEQVHLALGAPGSMTVTFVTVGSSDKSTTSQVQYRELSGGATNTVQAHVSTYTAGGWKGLIHKATLTGLTRGSYAYRCAADAVWSDWFDTKYLTSDPAKVTLAIVADLDGREADGISTIDALNQEAAKGAVDALLHAGDIAYIKGATNEATYDEYFRQLQPTASKVPYHVAVGNQEHWNNFSGYNSRFSMPGNTSMANYWHSIDVGPVHALFLSTEHPYDADSEQYSYALNDLKSVDKKITPWVLVLLHRPLYCSTNDYYDCQMAGPKKLRPALEPLFAAQGVDAVVAGHVHNYERTAGVLNGKISEKAPVHITVGNAGDIEGMTHGWQHPKPDWSLVQSLELAWSRWTVTKTSMLVELVASGNGTILDSVTYTK